MTVSLNWPKKFTRSSSKRSGDNYSKELTRRYYQSIRDMPIYNWVRIFQDKQLNYALIDHNGKIDKFVSQVLYKLQDEHAEIFGIDERYIDYLRAQVSLEILYNDMYLNNDKTIQNRINVLEAEIKENYKQESKTSFQDAIIFVEKQMGFRINQKETTVFEFYSYMENIKKTRPNGRRV